jgi:CRISPR-associated endonuclease/helicase Cas3
MQYIAHTKNGLGQRQDLLEHLRNVADMAAAFAAPFGAADLAHAAGLLHDIGKFNPVFQQYLLDSEMGIAKRGSGPEHKGAGTLLAHQMQRDPLAFLVAGHHGGLPDAGALLTERLATYQADPAVMAAITTAQNEVRELVIAVAQTTFPAWIAKQEDMELFIRLLFSALVDADRLDTEAHFNAGSLPDRGNSPTIAELQHWFMVEQQRFSGQTTTLLNQLRHEVYERCLVVAQDEPGFFRLTVPTGGGKTRSSLAFALTHATRYDMMHIIYAIPYMSITDQTAKEFRDIFQGQDVVLEHHSGVAPADPDAPTPAETQAQLAAENWDAPLIVTTTVQLFQSLLAAKTSPCRKLHNIANSVIILDEVQTLPPHVLTTILDVLRHLVEHYHVSVVLCTATQPALDDQPDFKGLPNVREIARDPAHLFAQLERVRYHWPAPDETWTWEQVAERMRKERQALAIVNTRADAAALLEALDDDTALHLSTWMCGAHRQQTLQEARDRLHANEPCLLVSTQLIEAGVDIDFPVVLRALGPLDSIVQAAGRCNREGELPDLGNVIVFNPADGNLPPGAYKIGTKMTNAVTGNGSADMHDPALYHRYFQRYYAQLDRDSHKVQPLRAALNYPRVAEEFRMIDDDTQSVVALDYDKAIIQPLLNKLRKQPAQARKILRRLQPFIVNLRQRELQNATKRGTAEEIHEAPGIWLWHGTYDPQRGIVIDSVIDPGFIVW